MGITGPVLACIVLVLCGGGLFVANRLQWKLTMASIQRALDDGRIQFAPAPPAELPPVCAGPIREAEAAGFSLAGAVVVTNPGVPDVRTALLLDPARTTFARVSAAPVGAPTGGLTSHLDDGTILFTTQAPCRVDRPDWITQLLPKRSWPQLIQAHRNRLAELAGRGVRPRSITTDVVQLYREEFVIGTRAATEHGLSFRSN